MRASCNRPRMIIGGTVLALLVAVPLTRAALDPGPSAGMTSAAVAWLDTLDPAQRARAIRPFGDESRTGWHFIPKNDRKGVQLRDMTPLQERSALQLLRSALSQAGYEKSVLIMRLDEILRLLEGERARNVRDPRRYYFTIFGEPAAEGTWGLSIEGHHLSLNFTVRDGRLVDSTPQFMGANPAEVRTTFPGLPETGFRVLAAEESLAFELVRSLDEPQRARALVAPEPPKEIRAAGDPQPPAAPPAGIAWQALLPKQQAILRRLIETYCAAMPAEVAGERLRLIESGPKAAGTVHPGWDGVHFAWSGALEPGIGHAYVIEGPTFVIEFVNVQPDAEGNPANHIHCVWRDRTGDFDLPPAKP